MKFDIITFDCYGTLIDWENGIADAFVAAGVRAGHRLNREAVLESYAGIEPLVEAEEYRSYRQVLTETAERVAASLGWVINSNEAAFLPDSLPLWKPFADTNRALEQLRGSGVRLAILSNTDEELIASTCRNFTVPFEFIVTAGQVRSYKPAPGHFLAARERIGDRLWLHAGASIFHDIVPTHALGVPNAWINRKGEALPRNETEHPDFVFRDLLELADAF